MLYWKKVPGAMATKIGKNRENVLVVGCWLLVTRFSFMVINWSTVAVYLQLAASSSQLEAHSLLFRLNLATISTTI